MKTVNFLRLANPVAEDLFKRNCPPPSRCAISKGIVSSAWLMRCLDTTDGLTPSLSRMSVRLAGLLVAKCSRQATVTQSYEQNSYVLQILLTSSTGSFMSESVHLSECSWRSDKQLCFSHDAASDYDSFPFFFFFSNIVVRPVLITLSDLRQVPDFVCNVCHSSRTERFTRMWVMESVKDWSRRLSPWKRRERKRSLMAWREHSSTDIFCASHQPETIT